MQGKLYNIGIVCAIALLTACGGNSTQGVKTEKRAVAIVDSTSGWYRCFKGYLGEWPVTLHVTGYTGNIHAVYYYDNQQVPIELWSWIDTNKTDKEIYLAENPPERLDSTARWVIQTIGDTIVGDWYSANGIVRYPIRLTVADKKLFLPFSVSALSDSIRLIDTMPEPIAQYNCQCLLPAATDDKTAFVRSVIYKSMYCDTTVNMSKCMQEHKDKYVRDYIETNREDFAHKNAGMPMHVYNWSHSESTYVVYNEQDIVVLDDFMEEYTGGAHGIYGDVYTTIDTRNKKVLTQSDIFGVDSTALLPVLEKEARKYFHIEDNKPLNSLMLVEELHVPANFYITGKGIVFVYGLYEIASFADGIIRIFVPYEDIMPMLKPEFKQRMNLETMAINQ